MSENQPDANQAPEGLLCAGEPFTVFTRSLLNRRCRPSQENVRSTAQRVEVIEPVEHAFLRRPVEVVTPVACKLTQISQVGAIGLLRAVHRVGPVGGYDPLAQLVENRRGDLHTKRRYIRTRASLACGDAP